MVLEFYYNIIDIIKIQVGRGIKKIGIGKIIKIVTRYLKCIGKSVQVQSAEETKEVKEQAMDVLQRAITAGLIRL